MLEGKSTFVICDSVSAYDVDLKDYEGIIYVDEDDYNEENAIEQKQCGFEISLFKDYHKKYALSSTLIIIQIYP